MEMMIAALLLAALGAASAMFGCDSRPSEHERQHNW